MFMKMKCLSSLRCCCLHSPFAYVDPLHCNMAYLYLELLKDSLNEYAYAAELAGLNYDLQNTIYGMYVSIQIILVALILHHPTLVAFLPPVHCPALSLK